MEREIPIENGRVLIEKENPDGSIERREKNFVSISVKTEKEKYAELTTDAERIAFLAKKAGCV